MHTLVILMKGTVVVILVTLIYSVTKFVGAAIRFQKRHNAESTDARTRMTEIEALAEIRKATANETPDAPNPSSPEARSN